ncbi:hypothetical protein MTsPCn9_06930 [Croceitalea sp. MTPC9]|uniref:HEAT repeat domain-containing protein n=1 Tax=unclassified Croceitalea TaxID=2632280 RepID=UPI002B3CB6FA|nr:hypothetical protein MTsPCn6_01780 [Croceitalea sp. MTPC6]GMN15757.1 hypothetical protein MTsPCn9_06930 [Croceitalea sp. MTPC9]
MNLTTQTYKSLLYVNSTATDTNVLWNLTFLFLGLGLLYFIFIFFFKNKLSQKAVKTASKRSELAPVISNFLFHSPKDSKDEQKEYVNLKIEIREYLRDKGFRKILAEILFDLQKDVSGTTEERLFKLYRELGLHHDAFAKLKSWRWEVVSKGILELTQMQVGESYQLITKFINDKRGTIRKQAEIATIKLRHEGIDYILDSTSYAISEWQQLKMIEALSGLKDYEPPRFKSWLISENKDVVLFALRLIKHYNQNDAAASIIELIKHKNDQIKLAAIQCIKDFNFVEAKSTLRDVFLVCNDEVKIQILGAIAIFGNESDIPFLNGVSVKELNFLVSSKARSAMNSIAPESVLPTKDITKTKAAGSDIEIPLGEEKKPSIIHSDDTITVSISDEYLEIETTDEMDVFEIDDSESDEIKNKEIVDPVVVVPEETDFDFEEMDNETVSSLDVELGLLSSENDDVYHSKVNVEEYAEMDFADKDTYLENMEETVDSKQVEFLEIVMEHEVESELRFKAFKKLKKLKTSFPVKKILQKESEETSEPTSSIIVESELPETKQSKDIVIGKEQESVFYPLFQKAVDLDSKLLLIKQMESLGDEKEIVFLQKLLNSKESKIVKLSKKTVAVLEKKLSDSIQDIYANDDEINLLDTLGDDLINPSQTFELENNIEAPYIEEKGEKDNKLPLELCFLYDEFGINASEEKDDDFDFELSEEFFLNLSNQKENHEH